MNDFNQQVTEHLRGIVKATQNEISAARSKILSEIPKFSLKKIHCDSASLVLNRNELIKKMAPNGIVAELGADSGKFSLEIVNVANPKKFIIVDAWNTERYGDDKAKGVAELFDEKSIQDKLKLFARYQFPLRNNLLKNILIGFISIPTIVTKQLCRSFMPMRGQSKMVDISVAMTTLWEIGPAGINMAS